MDEREISNYEVFPEPVPLSSKEAWADVPLGPVGGALAMFIPALVILFITSRISETVNSSYGLEFFLLTWALLTVAFLWIRNQRYCRERIAQAASEAQRLTDEARSALKSIAENQVRVPKELEKAANWLKKAEMEFNERGFAPCWDAIHEAAQHLDVFRVAVNQIAFECIKFRSILEHRNHSFPPLPVRFDMFPNPGPLVDEFHRLVRKGQTDFQFATIWEQRRTQEVLIAGFRTLQEGIGNLGSAVNQSLSGLEAALSTGFREFADEQANISQTLEAVRDEHGRMLDNIQRRRKPFP